MKNSTPFLFSSLVEPKGQGKGYSRLHPSPRYLMWVASRPVRSPSLLLMIQYGQTHLNFNWPGISPDCVWNTRTGFQSWNFSSFYRCCRSTKASSIVILRSSSSRHLPILLFHFHYFVLVGIVQIHGRVHLTLLLENLYSLFGYGFRKYSSIQLAQLVQLVIAYLSDFTSSKPSLRETPD